VDGLRADLTVCRAAAAWAAYQERTNVELADVEAVIELALLHRRRPRKLRQRVPRQQRQQVRLLQ